MSAMTLTVGNSKNGSMRAVAASGMAIMSDSLMACQARMEDPSKPKPSSKIPSSTVSMGYEQCCQVPNMSQNFMSTCATLCCLVNSKNSVGVIKNLLVFTIN